MSTCDPTDLMSWQTAKNQMLTQADTPSKHEQIPLSQAEGRVLAHEITSTIDIPPFDTSAMDGYAVNTDDLSQAGCQLPLSQTIYAGNAPQALTSNTTARILTGAPLPRGANSVIIQEACTIQSSSIQFNTLNEPGSNIRRQGCHVQKGQKVLTKGSRLTPAELGLLASLGLSSIQVYRPLRIGILSTGDELVSPGQPLQAGQIYNSNHIMLSQLATTMHTEVVDLGCLKDEPTLMRSALEDAHTQCDIIISSGSASVGDKDYINSLLAELGEVAFWKIKIKPGKPFTFGKIGCCDFIGLPGNPVSCFVTFHLLVRPFILKRQGIKHFDLNPVQAIADFSRRKTHKRTEFIRVSVTRNSHGQYVATPFPNQDSATLLSITQSDGLLEIPAGSQVNQGAPLPFYALRNIDSCL